MTAKGTGRGGGVSLSPQDACGRLDCALARLPSHTQKHSSHGLVPSLRQGADFSDG